MAFGNVTKGNAFSILKVDGILDVVLDSDDNFDTTAEEIFKMQDPPARQEGY
jgi:hypothetical protein